MSNPWSSIFLRLHIILLFDVKILGGAGVYDGSEVTEAVAAIVQLSRNECETHMFALDKEQMHTGKKLKVWWSGVITQL